MNKLVEEIKSTDDEKYRMDKLEELAENLKPLIYSMYRRYGYVEDSSNDAYQNSIIVLLESIEEYDPGQKLPFVLFYKNRIFYSYMEKIKMNKKLNNLLIYEEFDENLEQINDGSQDFVEGVVRIEELANIKTMVHYLGDKQRWIIIEHFYKGKKLAQIAKEHGMHYQSLVKLKKRALDNLRTKYREAFGMDALNVKK
ncbi:sigma-70 family RNA polymerase sigma factor [Alkalibacter mobilis]|uniref:sigma-70 family RNA polymerase sigma factor n=1 Tax=Alkalibacter mobilis TaxID=2787712 RepID=UPI00189CB688|nr:sigma-70 family RNA polymerase sigma factor [Alkalibacter mobilis]MBF7097501.1 sigma-70 family RNA polymerase sigma factor [Alkalibacter mobilis]